MNTVNGMPQYPGMRWYDSRHILNSHGNNGKKYSTIRPICYIVTISILFFVTIAAISAIVGMSVYFQFPASQGNFYTQNSWCFISNIENECVDSGLWWARDNDLLSRYDFYDNEKCWTDEVEQANVGAFCNTKSGQTIDWCISLFNTIVSNKTECVDFEGSYVFSTPEDYNELGYTYVHDSSRLSGSYFYGVGIAIVVWLAYAVLKVVYFPITVQRQGSNIVFRHSCCSSIIRLADIQNVIVIDQYKMCFHWQFLKSIRYMTTSCFCGAGEEDTCTFIVLKNGGAAHNFVFSLRADDAQQFMEENISVANDAEQVPMAQIGNVRGKVYPTAELAAVKQEEAFS